MQRRFTPVHVAALRDLDAAVQQTRPNPSDQNPIVEQVRALADRVRADLDGEPVRFTDEDAALLQRVAWEWIDDAPVQHVKVPMSTRIALGQTLLDARDVIADRLDDAGDEPGAPRP